MIPPETTHFGLAFGAVFLLILAGLVVTWLDGRERAESVHVQNIITKL